NDDGLDEQTSARPNAAIADDVDHHLVALGHADHFLLHGAGIGIDEYLKHDRDHRFCTIAGADSLSEGGREKSMAQVKNEVFELGGINHLALVCKDMARTVDFYSNVLGMPLVKTIDLPQGMGQHFFFDIGNGDCLAFFWFPNAPEAQPGI